MVSYGDPKYWDVRYGTHPEPFDWYYCHLFIPLRRLENYAALKSFINKVAGKEAKILMLGCGNALLSEEMYDDGYKNIDNIDISPVVIEQMKSRNAARPEMKFVVMDVRELKFGDGTYDLAIDKSTIDALLCGDNAYYNVALMMRVETVADPR